MSGAVPAAATGPDPPHLLRLELAALRQQCDELAGRVGRSTTGADAFELFRSAAILLDRVASAVWEARWELVLCRDGLGSPTDEIQVLEDARFAALVLLAHPVTALRRAAAAGLPREQWGQVEEDVARAEAEIRAYDPEVDAPPSRRGLGYRLRQRWGPYLKPLAGPARRLRVVDRRLFLDERRLTEELPEGLADVAEMLADRSPQAGAVSRAP